MHRPLTAAETSLREIYRSQLQPLAEAIERGATANAMASQALLSPAKRITARKQERAAAKRELWQHALRSNPTGLGIVELFLLKLVITELLRWIMRSWLDAHQDD